MKMLMTCTQSTALQVASYQDGDTSDKEDKYNQYTLL